MNQPILATIQAFDISVPYSGINDFKNHFFGIILKALDQGSSLVLLPEYSIYAATKLPEFKTREGLARLVWTELFPEVMKLSQSYDALILAGTGPNLHRDSGKFRNRAILAAGGKSIDSYKRCLAPWEYDFEAGNQTALFEWKGLKCASVIGYDIEFPEIASELKRYSPHLVLTPASSVDANEVERIHRCASARAVELGAIVLVAPLTGSDEENPLVTENIGKCAVYLPAQEAFSGRTAPVSAIQTKGDLSVSFSISQETLTKVKRMDSETKPFQKTLSAY